LPGSIAPDPISVVIIAEHVSRNFATRQADN
jgi:hypothetical protein